MNGIDYIKKIFKLTFNNDYRFEILAGLGLFNHLPDEKYLKRMFKSRFGYTLDLENPVTYSEKLQWLKLYDRQPLYTLLVDKYTVKDYVSHKIGSQYVIPTIGIWDRFEDIDFSGLPDRFVIKCTHDSGGVVICTDKRLFNKKEAKSLIEKSLRKNFYYYGREWPYKNVKPRVIVEKYIEDSRGKDLKDYKFFVFNGKVKALFVASDRQNAEEETKFNFFDSEFNPLPFTNGHPKSNGEIKKPNRFEDMLKLAEKLAEGIPHVRVDFYEVDNQIYFGEMTFFHWSGLKPFDPPEWDTIFGSWLELPIAK